jgi:hypothetical protein
MLGRLVGQLLQPVMPLITCVEEEMYSTGPRSRHLSAFLLILCEALMLEGFVAVNGMIGRRDEIEKKRAEQHKPREFCPRLSLLVRL